MDGKSESLQRMLKLNKKERSHTIHFNEKTTLAKYEVSKGIHFYSKQNILMCSTQEMNNNGIGRRRPKQ